MQGSPLGQPPEPDWLPVVAVIPVARVTSAPSRSSLTSSVAVIATSHQCSRFDQDTSHYLQSLHKSVEQQELQVFVPEADVHKAKKKMFMLPSHRPKFENWVGRSGFFFFFFLRTVRELSFPIFFFKFLNGGKLGRNAVKTHIQVMQVLF